MAVAASSRTIHTRATDSSLRKESMILFSSFSSSHKYAVLSPVVSRPTTVASWLCCSFRYFNRVVHFLRWTWRWFGPGSVGFFGYIKQVSRFRACRRSVVDKSTRSTVWLLLLVTAAALLISATYLMLTRAFTRIIMHITLILSILLNM